MASGANLPPHVSTADAPDFSFLDPMRAAQMVPMLDAILDAFMRAHICIKARGPSGSGADFKERYQDLLDFINRLRNELFECGAVGKTIDWEYAQIETPQAQAAGLLIWVVLIPTVSNIPRDHVSRKRIMDAVRASPDRPHPVPWFETVDVEAHPISMNRRSYPTPAEEHNIRGRLPLHGSNEGLRQWHAQIHKALTDPNVSAAARATRQQAVRQLMTVVLVPGHERYDEHMRELRGWLERLVQAFSVR